MNRILLIAVMACLPAAAATVNIPAGSTAGEIQATLNGVPGGSTIAFAPGTYSITATINVPCNLTLTGPEATPATVILKPSFMNQPIFNLTDCSGITIQYIHFTRTQSIKFNLNPGTWCGNGCVIAHNQFTDLTAQLPKGRGGNDGPACDSGKGPQGNCDSAGDTAITFASNSGAPCPGCAYLTNTQIIYNQFGDAGSCLTPADVMTGTSYDYGGNCAGVEFYTAIDGVTVDYNSFTHLEEGFHVLCGPGGGDNCSGPTAWTFRNFIADFNVFNGIHRFGAEMQLQKSANVHVDHNAYSNPTAPWAWTFGISNACCNKGATAPGITNLDNVIIADTKVPGATPSDGAYIGIADEAWGLGALYEYNVVQGNWQNGFTWAFIGGGSISHNIVCGAQMVAAATHIHQETTPPTSDAPRQTGNTISPTCSPVVSTPPTISPASRRFTGSQTVTLADAGTNHSVWYTTDGTTPVPGKGTAKRYSVPFNVTATTTIIAVGQWGTGPNVISFPAGYGYVPSAAVKATYTLAAPTTTGPRR
jgi:hypothetical protein